jgi:arginyl-tRNA synthetase
VHNRTLIIKYISTKQLVYSHIEQALRIYTQELKTPSIKDKKIPLYKGRDTNRILYISGVAQQLSKSHNCTAMEIAGVIVSHLLATSGDVLIVKIVPPGWIHFELTHSYLAAWLQNFVIESVDENEDIEIRENADQYSASLFAIQYAHARCCSLLLLAHREGLIKLREPAIQSLVSPDFIPWLNNNNQLRLHHQTEMCLITELVQVLDDLLCSDDSKGMNWEKIARKLSQAFENFWCHCRIWGEVKISAPELAQARLGLVMATGRLLRFLLVKKLGILAPLEL